MSLFFFFFSTGMMGRQYEFSCTHSPMAQLHVFSRTTGVSHHFLFPFLKTLHLSLFSLILFWKPCVSHYFLFFFKNLASLIISIYSFFENLAYFLFPFWKTLRLSFFSLFENLASLIIFFFPFWKPQLTQTSQFHVCSETALPENNLLY